MLAARLALVATSWGCLAHARQSFHSQEAGQRSAGCAQPLTCATAECFSQIARLEYSQSQLISAGTEGTVEAGGWSQRYPRWVDSGSVANDYYQEDDEEEYFFEDAPRIQRWSDSKLDSVPILMPDSGNAEHGIGHSLLPYSAGRGQMGGGGCTSMLAKHHIRGYTQTEQSSIRVGAGIVHSFSVVTISVSDSRNSGIDPYLYTAEDNFSDDFELTVLDEQATVIRKRSPVQGVSGCVIAVLFAGGAVLLMGVMLWATYAAAGAIVNFMFVQCDSEAQSGCLGIKRANDPELNFKNESVTAPLLKV
eukprot:jgi/Ulvmu1/1813/UM119_0031.1